MKVIIIFGPPGVGKGTQAALLAKKLEIEHISTGNILREEVAKKTVLGKEVDKLMKSGHLVSDDLIIKIIEERLSESKARGFIFDGFPRTLKQAEMLESMLEKRSVNNIKVVNLVADESELVKRLLNRAKLEGRADDNAETIQNRLKVYEKQTLPILEFFETSEKKVLDVDGIGDINEINERVLKVLK